MYYSRKICVYNFCVYDTKPPNDAACWSEVEGIEIGTALYTWVMDLPPAIKEFSLFSDICGGQKRNQNVAATLQNESSH